MENTYNKAWKKTFENRCRKKNRFIFCYLLLSFGKVSIQGSWIKGRIEPCFPLLTHQQHATEIYSHCDK